MNIVKLHDGSEEIVSDEELEAAAEIYDRIVERGTSPGPWHDGGNGQLVVSKHRPICDVMTGNRADVRLIAAAPELRDALQSLMEIIPLEFQTKAASAALAKAGVK